MLIVGIDPHKDSHTAAALDAATGEILGEITIDSAALFGCVVGVV